MKRLLLSMCGLICLASNVSAQAPNFPQVMPPNTVFGRSNATSGPGEAIPFSTFMAGVAGLNLNPTQNISYGLGSTVSPARAPIYWNGSGSGACTGIFPCAGFLFQASSWGVNTTTAHSSELARFQANVGGAGQIGHMYTLDATFNLSATSGNQVGQNSALYQAINSVAQSTVNDNGTGLTLLTANGSLWGIGNYCLFRTGSTNNVSCIGVESDISIETGASALFLVGYSAVLLSTNAVAPALQGVGFIVGSQQGAVAGWNCGFCFGGYQGDNSAGLVSGASLMAFLPNGGSGSGPTIANGIHLTGFTFTGNAFDSTGFAVNGSGVINPAGAFTNIGNDATHNGIQIGPGTTGNVPTIAGAGVDTNRGLAIRAQGTGVLTLGNISGGVGVNIADCGGTCANPITLNPTASGSATIKVPAAASLGISGGTGATGVYVAPQVDNVIAFRVRNAALSTAIMTVDTLTPAITLNAGVVAPSLPTSAGSGGLNVCVDVAGVLYKKSSCP